MPDALAEQWMPAIEKNPKAVDIFNCNTVEDDFAQFILVDGGRLNGKTLSVAQRAIRHLWETAGARLGIVSKTYRSAKQGGVWADLTEIVLPEWFASGMVGETGLPIEYTSKNGSGVGPAQDPLTRTPFFRIRNMYGGESECMLISLDNDNEIEAKVKSTRYSMFWFSELSNFEMRKVFDISILQLRMVHLRPEQHLWIADTNPPEDGEDSWFYKLWYEEIHQENHPRPGFQRKLRHIKVRLEDNMAYLSELQIDTLKGTYANDPGEYSRHVDGEYVKGHGTLDKHFADILIPDIHLVKPAIDANPTTDDFFTGWDIGNVNHAAAIFARRMVNDRSFWLLLDEVVTIGEHIRVEDFAYMVYEKMRALETFYRSRIDWRAHWADDTAINAWRAGQGGFDAAEVLRATGGQVILQGASKPEGSVGDGIRIMRRLLRDERLFIGENCPRGWEMLCDLRVSKDLKKKVDDTPLKHPFDAMRYPIYMEERALLLATSMPQSSDRSMIIHAG